MIKLPLLKINKTIKKLKVFIELLAENSFLVFLALFLISLFLGLIIFYHYVFLPENLDVIIKEEELLGLDLEKQARVLEEWQNRNDNFYKADSKERIDPFYRVD
jgi:hypothetical protein